MMERRAPRPSRSETAGRGRPALHLNSFLRFNKHSRPIGKHFRDPLHHLGCIVTEVLAYGTRSEEHTSELQSHLNLVCRLLLEKKKKKKKKIINNMNT